MKGTDEPGILPRRRARAGQTMIFAVMVVVILAFIALWNFDLHKAIYVKSLSQNAGDAAALAAARWQGATLNLIGDLNIMKAVALTEGDLPTAADIGDLQARLCYVGPMVAMAAAQQAAKHNGIFVNAAYTRRVEEHAGLVRDVYPTAFGVDGTMLFPEPYPGCWSDYADMLYTLADSGIAAAPDNARLYSDYAGDHVLLQPDFYDAVAGRDWCWFHHHEPDLLPEYTDYLWWPPLPVRAGGADPVDSEFFGLGLRKVDTLGGATGPQMLEALRQERNLGGSPITNDLSGFRTEWYCYDPGVWTTWGAFSPTSDYPFPATGNLRPQYDYAGADAAVRVEAEASRVTPGARAAQVTWTAAAKPFGHLNGERERPNAYTLVLPAFHAVRLIPVDTSSAPAGGAFDLDWRRHIEDHLPDYVASGPAALRASCGYCRHLADWEEPAFRRSGVAWLEQYSHLCDVRGSGGSGGGRGGGSRRGH